MTRPETLADLAGAVKIEKLTKRDKAAAARALLTARQDIIDALTFTSTEAYNRSGSYLRGFKAAAAVVADVFEDWELVSPIDTINVSEQEAA